MATAPGGKNLVRWLFAPAADDVPRGQAAAAVFLRVLLGLMWLYKRRVEASPGLRRAVRQRARPLHLLRGEPSGAPTVQLGRAAFLLSMAVVALAVPSARYRSSPLD